MHLFKLSTPTLMYYTFIQWLGLMYTFQLFNLLVNSSFNNFRNSCSVWMDTKTCLHKVKVIMLLYCHWQWQCHWCRYRKWLIVCVLGDVSWQKEIKQAPLSNNFKITDYFFYSQDQTWIILFLRNYETTDKQTLL